MTEKPKIEQADARTIEIVLGMLRKNAATAGMHGEGRNIVTCKTKDLRIVVVGGRFFRGNWNTFPGFLVEYLFRTLGEQWVSNQLAMPLETKHPLVAALGSIIQLQGDSVRIANHHGGVLSPYFAATLPLAHDLFLIENHAASLRDRKELTRLLRELKSRDHWRGARHEARAAAILLRAGFQIEWEDQTQNAKGGHPEFYARHPKNGKTLWVECKRDQSEPGSLPSVGKQLARALRKKSSIDRLVFIETDSPPELFQPEKGGWLVFVVNSIRTLEAQPSSSTLPSAHVIVTNFYEGDLSSRNSSSFNFLLEGFKTRSFRLGSVRTLEQDIEHDVENWELAQVIRSMKEHTHIPGDFGDGEVPLPRSGRPKIGESLRLPDGRYGKVVLGAVLPERRKFLVHVVKPGGKLLFGSFPLSDDDLIEWQLDRITFFGEPLVPIVTSDDSHAEVFRKIHNALAGGTEHDYRALLSQNGAQAQPANSSIPDLQRATAILFAELHLNHTAIAAPGWLRHLKPKGYPSPCT